ncbi:Transposable element Tcb2 transposase [Pyrenophora seminiperda CCB06]|uniref:Transposable element Tcb2 transposase n=1 Tax=Pyrenophora seminiperda CCB06 TaxID=1302712 RepID=A0A3M7LVS3_9PLEO|nr:Transposable element Tcb2 transposase [Pyrenophora seminiperda CCB06]
MRRELTPVERAFCAGACIVGQAKLDEVTALFPNNLSKSGLSRLISRIKQRAEDAQTLISDPILYETELGRGRKELCSQNQKNRIIELVTSDRNHREKEPWQAIRDGDFEEIVPKTSISTFENIMYDAGYARRKPGWKPKLSPDEENRRFLWALHHNPDKYAYGDGEGFDFRQVAYSDETPARVGEQRGMQRSWGKFYGIFTYNYKGPCVIYERESPVKKSLNNAVLDAENTERRTRTSSAQIRSRAALNLLNEPDINGRWSTTRTQYTRKDDYTRGIKSRCGIDRRQITRYYQPSTTVEECKSQWKYEWDILPQATINKWIDGIPEVVRRIISHGGKNNFHSGGG